MTDLEITRLCAEAMAFTHSWDNRGRAFLELRAFSDNLAPEPTYDPLHNDAQAMALVKKFPISIEERHSQSRTLYLDGPATLYVPPIIPWYKIKIDTGICYPEAPNGIWYSEGANLNRAICECVAKMEGTNHG